MNRDELTAELRRAQVSDGAVVYVERRGPDYTWRIAPPSTGGPPGPANDSLPEAWIFYSGSWPDEPRRAAFVEDLLAELESMTGGSDRCRWPLDEPWPHSH